MSINGSLKRKLRYALFGGGPSSFIGNVHRIAAELDSRAELVAGVFSSKRERSLEVAPNFGVSPSRVYANAEELVEEELSLPDDQRIDFGIVATPNNTHFEIARTLAEAGFHVFCDKPMTLDLAEALKLRQIVGLFNGVFALTHNYTGYPLIRHARHMVRSGRLGAIQAIRSQYVQGWLRTRLEETGQKQAAWRTDPKQSGAAGAFGDIGTHAYNLAGYVSGLNPESVLASLKTFEPGRQLDDYGSAFVRYTNGAIATITASQISHGRENDLSIEIDGTKGSLSWRQENPNELWFRQNGEPHQLITRDPNAPFMSEPGKAASRLPSGHPEAFFEAFANIYRSGFDAIVARAADPSAEPGEADYPTVDDGVAGMRFITACVQSSGDGNTWKSLADN